MDDEELLRRLEHLARDLGVEVRYEPTEGLSGRALLRGQKVVVVDAELPAPARLAALAALLAQEDYDRLYLPPLLRDLLDRHRPSGGGQIP